MKNESEYRRCKFCKRILISEKGLFCRRCLYEGRNTTGKIFTIVGGATVTYLGIKSVDNNNSQEP